MFRGYMYYFIFVFHSYRGEDSSVVHQTRHFILFLEDQVVAYVVVVVSEQYEV